jgi:hypothetical protein
MVLSQANGWANTLAKFGLKVLQQFEQSDVVLHPVERAVCNK